MKKRLNSIWNSLKTLDYKALAFRLLLIVAAVAALYGLVYLAFLRSAPELLPLLKGGDEEAIAAYLGSQNEFTGIISTALLQFIQPVSIVLPGAPIQIAAGIVYGTLKGFLICYIANALANGVVFYLARVLRQKIENVVSRLSNRINFLQNAQYPVYMSAMACLVPVVPNGIIPYAAARTRMKLSEFLTAVLAGSFFPILIMCAIGKQILHGEYLFAAILLVLDVAVVVVLTKYRSQVCSWMHGVGESLGAKLRQADLPQEEEPEE